MFGNKLSICIVNFCVKNVSKTSSYTQFLRLFRNDYVYTFHNELSKMASKSCVELDKSIVSSGFFDSIDYVLTDCDGVLWDVTVPIPGSIETIHALKKLGKHVIYVTNNSTKTREEYLKKCETLGFPATLNDIISTPYCAATYLKSQNFQKKVYIFGCPAIASELEKVNIRSLPVGPDPVPDNWIQWLSEVKLDPEVGAVIVGFDHHISYSKLTKAASYLRNPDILFIATNQDEQCEKDGFIIPCTGTLVSAVEVVSDRKATTLGKPEQYILECVKHNHPNIDFSRCIMVGDRLNTDILLGSKHGIRTLFVLTGVNTLDDVQRFQNSSDANDLALVPDYYLPSLGDLKKFI